jgi:hypothetical protein
MGERQHSSGCRFSVHVAGIVTADPLDARPRANEVYLLEAIACRDWSGGGTPLCCGAHGDLAPLAPRGGRATRVKRSAQWV